MHPFRTHTCGELRPAHIHEKVKLSGWLYGKRDFGGLLFLDLRDHYGRTQVVVNQQRGFFEACTHMKLQSVLTVEGHVQARESVNPDLPTGDIEVIADSVTVESSAETVPLHLVGEEEDSEDLRLRYRYLDLRRDKLQGNIKLRSDIIAYLRASMHEHGFREIQTPILTSSSPEGARDYLVPSRVHPGNFYALPQAPQIFKQLLMVAGFDRYFQIAPCFRDEDARADRSPGEFYQLDMEMSFATQDEIFGVIEDVLSGLFSTYSDAKVDKAPFRRIPYAEAMLTYGSDKPDLRNPLEISDVTAVFADSGFNAFKNAITSGSVVRAIPVKGVGDQPRRFFDTMEAHAKDQGARGLAYLVWTPEKIKGPIAKFLGPELDALKTTFSLAEGDGVFLVCDQADAAARIMGVVRTCLGEALELIEENAFRFCWIVDFPMFERDEETEEIIFSHNPFSMPQGGLNALEAQDPLDVLAYQYDSVCNGVELSSGAIRNHRRDIMVKAFEIAGYGEAEIQKQFPALFNAFRYGAPPHGGIAPGLDRIVMLLAGEENIREVIAFPMNQKAQDLMMGAPAPAKETQLAELFLALVEPPRAADDTDGE